MNVVAVSVTSVMLHAALLTPDPTHQSGRRVNCLP